MKLRRIGNSLGMTFTRAALAKAGMVEGQELEILASPGEMKIVPTVKDRLVVCFTTAEASALAEGKLESKAGKAALNKVSQLVVPDELGRP